MATIRKQELSKRGFKLIDFYKEEVINAHKDLYKRLSNVHPIIFDEVQTFKLNMS